MLIPPNLLVMAALAVQSTPASPRQSSAPAGEVLAADTPRTTIEGNRFIGLECLVGAGPSPTLIVRDAQHEYVFAATS